MALTKDTAKLEIAKDYYRQIYQKDISAIDGINRNPEWARSLLWSYARKMATSAKRKNIFADVKATQNVTDITLASYVDALEALFVVKDIDTDSITDTILQLVRPVNRQFPSTVT